jgi:hypothetical protein
VLEFAPTTRREVWTYATCRMSKVQTAGPIELHLLSPVRDDRHVESLTAIAHFHHNVSPLSLGDSVNLGRPWLGESLCSYAYLSLHPI